MITLGLLIFENHNLGSTHIYDLWMPLPLDLPFLEKRLLTIWLYGKAMWKSTRD